MMARISIVTDGGYEMFAVLYAYWHYCSLFCYIKAETYLLKFLCEMIDVVGP